VTDLCAFLRHNAYGAIPFRICDEDSA